MLGGTDLAAGRMVGMAAVICASLLQAVESSTRVYQNMPRLPIFLPMLLAVALCVIFCFVHGLIVAKLKVAPFIASLGIQQVVYGPVSYTHLDVYKRQHQLLLLQIVDQLGELLLGDVQLVGQLRHGQLMAV